jgi:hypothetical protein
MEEIASGIWSFFLGTCVTRCLRFTNLQFGGQ